MQTTCPEMPGVSCYVNPRIGSRSARSRISYSGGAIVRGEPSQQRAVVRRERRGFRELGLVRLDEHAREMRRQRRVLDLQPAEEVAEALRRADLAMVDRAQPLGLLPRRGERLVALRQADRGGVRLQQRVQAPRGGADRATADVDLRQSLAVEVHERVEEIEEDRVVTAARHGRSPRRSSGLRLVKPSSRPCQCVTAVSPYFQHRFTTRPSRRWGKSTSPSAKSLMVPPIPVISESPALTISVRRVTCAMSAFHAPRSIMPPPAKPIRSRSASRRPAMAPASSFARMTAAITRASVGISVSTSAGSK